MDDIFGYCQRDVYVYLVGGHCEYRFADHVTAVWGVVGKYTVGSKFVFARADVLIAGVW